MVLCSHVFVVIKTLYCSIHHAGSSTSPPVLFLRLLQYFQWLHYISQNGNNEDHVWILIIIINKKKGINTYSWAEVLFTRRITCVPICYAHSIETEKKTEGWAWAENRNVSIAVAHRVGWRALKSNRNFMWTCFIIIYFFASSTLHPTLLSSTYMKNIVCIRVYHIHPLFLLIIQ